MATKTQLSDVSPSDSEPDGSEINAFGSQKEKGDHRSIGAKLRFDGKKIEKMTEDASFNTRAGSLTGGKSPTDLPPVSDEDKDVISDFDDTESDDDGLELWLESSTASDEENEVYYLKPAVVDIEKLPAAVSQKLSSTGRIKVHVKTANRLRSARGEDTRTFVEGIRLYRFETGEYFVEYDIQDRKLELPFDDDLVDEGDVCTQPLPAVGKQFQQFGFQQFDCVKVAVGAACDPAPTFSPHRPIFTYDDRDKRAILAARNRNSQPGEFSLAQQGLITPSLVKRALQAVRTSTPDDYTELSESPPGDEPSLRVGQCGQAFCWAGCVCASILGGKWNRPHCGKVGCMLVCACRSATSSKPTGMTRKSLSPTVPTDDGSVKRRRVTKPPARLVGGDFVCEGLPKIPFSGAADVPPIAAEPPRVPPIRIVNLSGNTPMVSPVRSEAGRAGVGKGGLKVGKSPHA